MSVTAATAKRHGTVPAVAGQTITTVDVFQSGSTTVVQINYGGGPTYIKVGPHGTEINGTQEVGTGTKLFD